MTRQRLVLAIAATFLLTLAADSPPTLGAPVPRTPRLKLKTLKPNGFEHLDWIEDWVVTKRNLSVVLAESGKETRDGEVGVFTMRPNGKMTPFRALGTNGVSGAIAWPDSQAGRGRQRAAHGLLAFANERDGFLVAIEGATVNAKGKVGALHPIDEFDVPPGATQQVRMMMAPAGTGAILVVTLLEDRGADTGLARALVYRLGASGSPVGSPVELSFPGDPTIDKLRPLDLAAADGGHVLLAHQRPQDPYGKESDVLLTWFLPDGMVRSVPLEGEPFETPQLPHGAVAFRYSAAQFLPSFGGGDPAVFYTRVTRWDYDYAKPRDLVENETRRFVRPATATGAPVGPATEIATEPWAYVQQILDRPGGHTAANWQENSGLLPRERGDYLFVDFRDASDNLSGYYSWKDPRQKYSVYSLDPTSGEATLLAATEVKHPGHPPVYSGVEHLVRRFGNKPVALFHLTETFSYDTHQMLAKLPR